MSAFDPIPRGTFVKRRARIAAALDGGVMVLPAAPARTASRDTTHPYRPDSDLVWATGFTEPETIAVIVSLGGGESRTELFVRERDPEAEQWAGARLGPERACERVGADAAHPLSAVDERLPALLRGASSVHYRLGAGAPALERLVLDALRWRRGRGARDGSGPTALVDPGAILDPLRLRKDAHEIARIRRAVEVTMESFREMMGAARPGIGEWELEGVLEGAFRRAGADGPAYETIVGSGANGCVLHYVRNSDVAREGDLVLVDAGCSWDLYASDLTRTFPVTGRFSSEQLDLYRVVEGARAVGVAAAGPGRSLTEIHDLVRHRLAEGLVELGLLDGDPADRVEDGELKRFYPHQTSHWLGLDVHDVGDYARGDTPVPLEAGMVFTVEPGLYIPPGTGGTASRFEGLGIRIEDDVLVTPEGADNLSSGLPTDPESLQALIEG